MSGILQEEIDKLLNAKLFEKSMEQLEEFWVQLDFKERISLRPYQFHSFSYKDKTQRALSSFRIKATDKNGLIHTFRLEAIGKKNGLGNLFK